MALADGSRSYSKIPGRYILENPEQLRGFVTPPAYVRIDITGGMQRIFISDQDFFYALFNGLRVTEDSKDVFSAISGVDDGTYGRSVMTHIRGHMLSDDEIEFYYISTLEGLGWMRILEDHQHRFANAVYHATGKRVRARISR